MGTAATAGITAAGSGAAFRVAGYDIPWSAILGVALVSGMGAYAYETKKLADVDRKLKRKNTLGIKFPFLSFSPLKIYNISRQTFGS